MTCLEVTVQMKTCSVNSSLDLFVVHLVRVGRLVCLDRFACAFS